MSQAKPTPAVSAIIIEDGSVLLIKRAFEPARGKWSAPGGSVEFGETLVDAVKRETLEETGLEIEVSGLAGVSDVIVSGNGSGKITHHYVLISFFAKVVGGELKASSDAEDARWVALSDIRNWDVTKTLINRLVENGLIV